MLGREAYLHIGENSFKKEIGYLYDDLLFQPDSLCQLLTQTAFHSTLVSFPTKLVSYNLSKCLLYVT